MIKGRFPEENFRVVRATPDFYKFLCFPITLMKRSNMHALDISMYIIVF